MTTTNDLKKMYASIGDIVEPHLTVSGPEKGITVTHPYCMTEGRDSVLVPVWLQVIDLTMQNEWEDKNPAPSHRAVLLASDAQRQTAVNSIAFQKPRAVTQTLDRWMELEPFTKCGIHIPRANAIGLRELIVSKQLPLQEDGKIQILWHTFSASVALVGYWCDSDTVARQFVSKVHKEARASYESVGIDWNKSHRELFELRLSP